MAAVVAVLFVLVSLAAVVSGPAISRIARQRLIAGLREHFGSHVSLGDLKISLFPQIVATGESVVFRKEGSGDAPPLIQVRRFTARTGFLAILAGHVSVVTVEGLNIQVPPQEPQPPQQSRPGSKLSRSVVIDELIADGTKLTVFPKDPAKEPLEFDIQQLRMQKVSADTSMPFQAVLMNAKPPGLINSQGRFGPWNKEDPGDTPVAGQYTFRDADLSVFKGIAGTLSSDGKYQGVLQHIEADGTTDVPNFTVQISGNPVHLVTQFHAVIDGTNGSTLLQPVNAQFGHSAVTASGSVEGKKGQGKTVSLDIIVNQGRLEDMLKLAMNTKTAMMNGAIAFRAKLVIPPGTEAVPEKINLTGVFNVGDAKFSQLNVQEKLNEISHRGEGQPKEPDTDPVVSDFRGRFTVRAGVLSVQNVSFNVPGIDVAVNGSYQLMQHEMDFHCDAKLQAKISQTTTGFKSFLLKALDPLFKKKNVGAEIPFKVTGDPSKPSIGLDLFHNKP